jgi:hypothetical protein
MSIENKKLVTNFLEEIKKNLPEWLKSNKDKVEDILSEISSHIWDSAQEIAGSDDPDSISLQKAINQLGNPKEIAKSYKNRGTPKYFVSEELWQIYTKVIGALIAVIFTVIVIAQVALIEPNNLLQALTNGFTLSLSSVSIFIIIVTAIFVGLSHEGYFPSDLGADDVAKESKNNFYKPGEFLFNGLVGVLFGFFIIIQPLDVINLFRIIVNFVIELFGSNVMIFNSASISIELQTLLTIIGIFAIVTGVTNLLKITKDIGFHLTMNVILIITGIVDLGISLFIMFNLYLLSEMLPLSDNILLFLAVLGVIGAIIGIIQSVRTNIKLYGFLEEKKFSSIS